MSAIKVSCGLLSVENSDQALFEFYFRLITQSTFHQFLLDMQNSDSRDVVVADSARYPADINILISVGSSLFTCFPALLVHCCLVGFAYMYWLSYHKASERDFSQLNHSICGFSINRFVIKNDRSEYLKTKYVIHYQSEVCTILYA